MRSGATAMKHGKKIATIICILGVSGVAGGMAVDNDILFIAGLVLVVGGYLIIRGKLKADRNRDNR
jgi:uncharacterized membrane protein YtjA (UPF0391 family)